MLTAPQKRPQGFGFKAGDTHLVGNAATKTVKAYDFSGKLLWERPALFDGQHPNWRIYQGDTPPGLYKIGAIYNDYEQSDPGMPAPTRELRSYGWVTFDLIDLEGNEDGSGRGGICLHGGGSGLGWPGSWQPYQSLLPTWGCVRMHNRDLYELVLPLTLTGTVFFSIWQDDK